ncbi:MAG: PAS domain S-box protein [Halorientalis sp.]
MTETTTLRVLHLDDESTVLSTTENYFERFEDDITIETTTNPSDALDRLETGAYDCLLCDYEMPGMDGLAILDRLQGDGPDVPFVMYTGRGSEDVASEAISQGADDYLRKDEGVDHYERLASTIRDAVEDHRAAASTGPGAETGNGPPAHSGSPVDAMVSVDADGRITEIDDQAASLLGSSPEQLRSSRLTENLAGEWTAVVAANVETALTTDAPVGFSLEQSGTTVHGIVRPDSDGATVQFAGEAEAPSTTAHASAVGGQRLVVETLVESLPELFHAFDTEGTLVHWNERVTDVSGYSDEELDLMTVWDLVPAREHRAVADAVDGIIESGTPDRIEIHYLTRQGYEIPYEFTGAPITNEAGDVVGVASLGRDVTERKARQDRLEKTRRQLDMALEETDTGVWIFDPTTTTVTPHGKTAELFGVDPDETDGTVYTQQIHPDDYDAAIEAVRRAADTGEPYDSEFRVQIDGTDRWLESKGKVITDGTDETPEMFGVITDITERKAREEELRTLRQRFERFAENVQDGFFLLSADYSEMLR